jgi:hypothetical protein
MEFCVLAMNLGLMFFNVRDNVNLMFSDFLNTYLRIFNHNFPYKSIFKPKNSILDNYCS